jgi:F5/8 type C domain
MKIILFFLLACSAAAIQVEWNPNPESNIKGYKLYQIDSPNLLLIDTTETRAAIDIPEGSSIAVLAYNTNGINSQLSVPLEIPITSPKLPRDKWVIRSSSEESVREDAFAKYIKDETTDTFWHTDWDELPPHFISIELPEITTISALRYFPRQDGNLNGVITDPDIEISDDGIMWRHIIQGAWLMNSSEKMIKLGMIRAKYIRMWTNNKYASCSNIDIHGISNPVIPQLITIGLQRSENLATWENLSESVLIKKENDFFRIYMNISGREEFATYKLTPITP